MTDYCVDKTAWLDKHRLTNRRRIFVLSYLETLNATEAAREAAYKFPNRQGPRLLANVGVRAAVKEGQAEIEKTIQVRAEDVARRWWVIANTLPSSLIHVQRGACRYCHGQDFQFHWRTKREYEEACKMKKYGSRSDEKPSSQCETATSNKLDQIGDGGGYGYSKTASPHLDCPECDGQGIPFLWVADTRDLSPDAAFLFNGARRTPYGIEISLLDRLKALDSLARHLGMFS